MPPKKAQGAGKKATTKQIQKQVEDKTFGLKVGAAGQFSGLPALTISLLVFPVHRTTEQE
jgi:hypothetical protein